MPSAGDEHARRFCLNDAVRRERHPEGVERYELNPGDAYFFDSRKPHAFKNIGDEDLELVSACTPPSF
jgi:mannose-6-phosphate isomerase-like protein (cupin superfamily)